MKDIDFLPEWYKNGLRREVSYRAQYMALGGVFLVMTVWSFATTHSISRAKAELAQTSTMHTQANTVSAERTRIENRLKDLRQKFESIEEVDSRIDVADVLAEMGFLIEDTIVLSKVEFVAERFPDEQSGNAAGQAGAIVRAIRTKTSENKRIPVGHVRFKIVIAGIAADATNVPTLIRMLEDSPYFCQVVPSFSQSGTVHAQSDSATSGGVPNAGTNIPVTEFEIHCYLANYQGL